MSESDGVSVVIPAFREREGLGLVLSELQAMAEGWDRPVEIVVVDDASDDGTAEVAVGSGVSGVSEIRLVRHDRNLGYGASLKTGIQAARFETIAIIDADGTYPAEAIPGLVESLAGVDMVVGDRSGHPSAIPLVRRPAKAFLRALARYVTGISIPDLNSGLRVFRKSLVAQYLSILSERFSFTTTLTIAALCDGLSVVYCPIEYRRRVGRSKLVAWDFFAFLSLVTRLSILFRPLRVFAPMALASFFLGGIKLAWDISVAAGKGAAGALLETETVSTSAVVLFLVAVQMLLMGMMAESMARRGSRLGADYVPARLRTDQTFSESGEV
jgi:glycosyltransferase involved in cell wall biosynthesis